MGNLTQISESLVASIKDGELQNVSIDILEAISDTMFKDGLLKDIPILGTLFGLTKASSNIKDKLFGKKLLYFLIQFKDIPKQERIKQINKIQADSNYRTKVGEKILFIIDKCEDSEKSELVGKLFKAFLEEKITYGEFLRCSNCIENVFLEDLLEFIKSPSFKSDIKQSSSLLNAGIMALDNIKPKVTAEKNRYSMKDELVYNVENTKLTCSISPIGALLLRILK